MSKLWCLNSNHIHGTGPSFGGWQTYLMPYNKRKITIPPLKPAIFSSSRVRCGDSGALLYSMLEC